MVRNELIVLVVVCGIVLGGIGGPVQPVAAEQLDSPVAPSLQDADNYVVEQGSFCRPIEPISSGESIESYYDYRSHETHDEGEPRNYSSYGTTDIQRDDASTLFLHEGPDGLSIGMVHDQLHGDTAGGIATFDFVGLPAESEWVVQDDRYEGESNMDVWDNGEMTATASWIWEEERTDGGAIRGGLDGSFAVTIYPAFNEDAEFAGDEDLWDPEFHGDGEITSLDVVSDAPGTPDRETLPSLSEPLTIRTGTCDDPSLSYDLTDDGLGVSVSGADDGDLIPFHTPYGGDGEHVRFERVDVRSSGDDLAFAFENRSLESTPAGVESIGHLTVTGDPGDSGASATVTFTVDRDRAAQLGLESDEIALYERDGDAWRESPTTLQDETDDAYRFTANVTSFGSLVVAPTQPLERSSVSVNESTITEGESVRVTVSVENPHYATKSYAANFTVFGEQVDSQRVSIEGATTERITFEQEFIEQGTYTIEVNGETLEVVVEPDESDRGSDGNESGSDGGDDAGNGGDSGAGDGTDSTPGSSPMPGFGFVAGVGALLALVALRVVRARGK